MKYVYLFLFILMLPITVSAVNWQCHEETLMALGSSYLFQGRTFEYTSLEESLIYPGYFLDPVYTVTVPGLSYRSNYTSSAWTKITQPDFTIDTYFLFGGNQTHNKFCVDIDFNSTPVPTPTYPDVFTPVPTSTELGGNGGNEFCYDGNCSQYPDRYQEGSYGGLEEKSLPPESQGFRAFIEGSGYASTGKGIVAMLQDYSMAYMIIGLIIFLTKLLKGD